MKWVLLALFSLILLVSSEDAVEPQLSADQFTADSLFGNYFAEYYDPNQKQISNRKVSKPKTNNKITQNKNKPIEYVENEKIPEYVEILDYFPVDNYNYKDNKGDYKGGFDYKNYKAEYERLVGRKGLGFDKRTATSYGLRAPLTPELLEVVGNKYYEGKEETKLIV